MRIQIFVLGLVVSVCAIATAEVVAQGRRNSPITIRAARVLDGRGGVVTSGVIEVRGSKITAVDQRTGPVTYDLGDATVLPGMIDVHVHLNWYFGPNGQYGERDVPAGFTMDAIVENARKTLMAGFTTVQSLGWQGDKALREAIAAGVVPGPRLLSSLGQIQPRDRPPGELRDRVRGLKTAGADAVKIFASGSIRNGGKMSATKEQLEALCGEARARGLRTLVHAHDPQSIITAVNAGCTQIEHGVFADEAAIEAMKDANVFFDPNIGLVLQNYVEQKAHYLGTGNFDAAGFAFMEKAVPTLARTFKMAREAGSACLLAPMPWRVRTGRTRAKRSSASGTADSRRWKRSSRRPRSPPSRSGSPIRSVRSGPATKPTLSQSPGTRSPTSRSCAT